MNEESGLFADESQLVKVGHLVYEFTDASIYPKIMEMHIYKASQWSGEWKESPEMIPCWHQLSELPYTVMWADNQYWLDTVLKGQKVKAYFLYSDVKTISRYEIDIVNNF